MRINHNITAMTAQASLFHATNDVSKSITKLSTGLRINSAADDAAGLSVSEKLRTQVRGMQQALRNTQDAIALLNIADGALNEQSSILQRMRELLIQAKNDTNTQTDRNYMFQEFSQLGKELDRIAVVTNYNGMRIFAAPVAEGKTLIPFAEQGPGSPNKARYGNQVFDTKAEGIFGALENSSSNHFNMMIGANVTSADNAAFNPILNSYDRSAEDLITIQFGQMDLNGILNPDPSSQDIHNFINSFDFHDSPTDWANGTFNNQDFLIDLGWDGVTQGWNNNESRLNEKLDFYMALLDGTPKPSTMNLVFGNRGPTNKTGIARINEMRATIGAMTNRLEHNVANLLNQTTNTQAAESQVRDVDFASESTKLTRSQILTQAAVSIQAQANMLPRQMLQLLG
jgi:flagellin